MTTRPPSLLSRKDRARPVTPLPTPSPSNTSQAWIEILGLSQPDTVQVTDTSVRGLPAVDRARSLVVNNVATMLTTASVHDEDGSPQDVPTVIRRPHPLLGRHEYYVQVLDNLVMHGNFVAIKIGDDPDDMTLLPVPLGSVSVDMSSGLPEYTIEGRIYKWWEIWHLRRNAPVGSWWGVGVIEQFRTAFSEQLHGQAYGENSFKTGGVPSVSAQLDVAYPTSEQVDVTKSGLMTKMGNGKREPLVHGKALTLTPLSWSPHDAEFIEARKLSVAEAALIMGLRPEDLGASFGSSMTYANRSDDNLQRITDSYAPYMAIVENGLSDLLDPGMSVVGNPEALLRTSTKERFELRQLAQGIGIETAEESRQAEGRSAIQTAPTEEAEQ